MPHINDVSKAKAAKQETPITFWWSVIRPYKYYYLLMAIAPIGSGILSIFMVYLISLLFFASDSGWIYSILEG